MESPPPPAGGWSRDTRKQFEGNTMAVEQTSGPEVRLLNLHFFNICRHHPTLKFNPRATDDERYVWGIDGVGLPLMLMRRIIMLYYGLCLRIINIHGAYMNERRFLFISTLSSSRKVVTGVELDILVWLMSSY